MNLPKSPIHIYGPIHVGAYVGISSVQDYYGLKYNVCQCGHIESISDDNIVINWHHGVAPKQTVNINEIIQFETIKP